jgi:hypothetical protein
MNGIPISRIGGAANSGSSKPLEERQRIEREQFERDDKRESPPQGGDKAPLTPSAPQAGVEQRDEDAPRE